MRVAWALSGGQVTEDDVYAAANECGIVLSEVKGSTFTMLDDATCVLIADRLVEAHFREMGWSRCADDGRDMIRPPPEHLPAFAGHWC